jgi:hypothetical protein
LEPRRQQNGAGPPLRACRKHFKITFGSISGDAAGTDDAVHRGAVGRCPYGSHPPWCALSPNVRSQRKPTSFFDDIETSRGLEEGVGQLCVPDLATQQSKSAPLRRRVMMPLPFRAAIDARQCELAGARTAASPMPDE